MVDTETKWEIEWPYWWSLKLTLNNGFLDFLLDADSSMQNGNGADEFYCSLKNRKICKNFVLQEAVFASHLHVFKHIASLISPAPKIFFTFRTKIVLLMGNEIEDVYIGDCFDKIGQPLGYVYFNFNDEKIDSIQPRTARFAPSPIKKLSRPRGGLDLAIIQFAAYDYDPREENLYYVQTFFVNNDFNDFCMDMDVYYRKVIVNTALSGYSAQTIMLKYWEPQDVCFKILVRALAHLNNSFIYAVPLFNNYQSQVVQKRDDLEDSADRLLYDTLEKYGQIWITTLKIQIVAFEPDSQQIIGIENLNSKIFPFIRSEKIKLLFWSDYVKYLADHNVVNHDKNLFSFFVFLPTLLIKIN